MASFISVIRVFNQTAISKNAAATHIVDLSRYNCEGFFSMQIDIAGTGNIDLTYAISNDGVTYITPTGTDDLFTAFGASSGEGSDGHSITSFDPPLARYIQFTATEQNVNPITSLDCFLAIQ